MNNELVYVNFQKELDRAKDYNYKKLFKRIKEDIMQAHKNDIALMIMLVTGDLDECVEDTIKGLQEKGLVDNMYAPIC